MLPRFQVTLVRWLHFPDLDLLDRRGGAPRIGVETTRGLPVHVRRHHRLAAAREDFDQVLVDENTQFHIFAGWQIGNGEGRFRVADAEGAVVRLKVDG